MIAIVSYISQVVKKSFRIMKYRRMGKNDIATSYIATFGSDYIPKSGSKLVAVKTTNSESSVIIGVVSAADENMGEGDKSIYSFERKAIIYLRDNGDIEIKAEKITIIDGNDNAVRYSKLEEAFNQLKADLNQHITNWNSFANVYVPGSPSTLGTPPMATSSTQTSADITKSKIENIKVP